MWCSKLFLAPLPFASNINPSFLIHFEELGNQLSLSSSVQSWGAGDAPSPQPRGGLSPVPPRSESPPWGCALTVCWALAHFSPAWCQLERDALLTLRGQPHFTPPQHPLPHSGRACSALHRSMPASGCFLVTTGPGKSHWLLGIVFLTTKQ